MGSEDSAAGPSGRPPRARVDLLVQEVGDEGLVYDREQGRVHILNRTALAVWRLCDGATGIEAIAERVIDRFPGAEAARVRSDVERVLADFYTRGLLDPE